MDGILEKYLGDIKTIVPVSRISICLVAYIASVISHDELRVGVFRTLLAVKLSSLNFDADGMLKGSMIVDVLFAAFISLASWVVYFKISKGLMARMWRHLNVDSRVDSCYAEYQDISTIPADVRIAALEYGKKESERRLLAVKYLARTSEFMIGVSIVLLIMSFYAGVDDAFFALIAFVVGGVSQLSALFIYLQNVLPYELHVSALSGSKMRLGLPS